MKPNTTLVHPSGYSCAISRDGAATLIRGERRHAFSVKDIRRKEGVYRVGNLEIKVMRPATSGSLRFDIFSAIELAAKAFGVPESRLHDAVTGWRESASLMQLWENWLNANPQFRRAVAA